MLIPSETVMVPKGTAFPPASSTPSTEASQFVQMGVAWSDHAPGRADGDLRFGKVLILETHGPEHRAVGSSVISVNHDGRKISVTTTHNFD